MDELKSKVRFRLAHEPNNWTVRRSYVSRGTAETLPTDKWKIESYHPSFKAAAKHMLERLIAEGYKPKGLDALIARVEEAERRILAWCEERCTDPDAEMESL